MTGIYRGTKSTQIFDSLEAARTSIPATGAASIEVWEFGQTIEFVRDPNGTDLTTFDGATWRREATFAEATAAAAAANEQADRALAEAGNAQTAAAAAEAAATQAQDAAVEAAEAAVAVPEIQADLREIKDISVYVNGEGIAISLVDAAGERIGDVIRIVPGAAGVGGLDLRLAAAAQQVVEDRLRFEIGPELEDGSRDLITVRDGVTSGAIARIARDGWVINLAEAARQAIMEASAADGLVVTPETLFAPETIQRLSDEIGGGSAEYQRTEILPGSANVLPRRVAGVTQHVGDAGIGAAARYVDGVGGEWDWVYDRCAIVLNLGQSNADPQALGESFIFTDNPTPDHVLMPNDWNGTNGGLRGWNGFPITVPTTALVPAVEQGVQSSSSAFAAAVNVIDPQGARLWIATGEARGGATLIAPLAQDCIWKTETDDPSQARINTIAKMTEIMSLAPVAPSLIVINFTHQESDRFLARGVYRDQCLAYMDDVEADLAFTGLPIVWICNQWGGYSGGATIGSNFADKLDIVEVCETRANAIMAIPRYHLPFGLTTGALPDQIHHSYLSRVRMAEAHAFALRDWEDGRGWQCAKPVSAVSTGDAIFVEFTAPTPMTADPDLVETEPYLGFSLTGTAITITGVEQVGGRRWKLTTSAHVPAGALVGYSYRGKLPEDVDTRYPVGAGSLREQWTAKGPITGLPVYRPALSWEITVTEG